MPAGFVNTKWRDTVRSHSAHCTAPYFASHFPGCRLAQRQHNRAP
jgi:hypothetical protein